MELIDTHIHLYADEFSGQQDKLLKQALEKSISKVILPNIDLSSIEGMNALVKNYPLNCFAMMGLHPCYVNDQYVNQLKTIEKHLQNGNYKAVGEIGLDKHWSLEFINEQFIALETQLNWAQDMSLPVSIHTRNATSDTIQLLKKLKLKVGGVFHCFGGSIQEAKQIIDLGMYLGIGGVVTFKNAGLIDVVKEIPLSSLVLETDGPYLAPAPYRGKTNLPEYLYLVAEKIANIKNMSIEEVAAVTTANAKKIFKV